MDNSENMNSQESDLFLILRNVADETLSNVDIQAQTKVEDFDGSDEFGISKLKGE